MGGGGYTAMASPYDEVIVEVKELLKDATVVGHDIKSEERALCFDTGSVAHCVYDKELKWHRRRLKESMHIEVQQL